MRRHRERRRRCSVQQPVDPKSRLGDLYKYYDAQSVGDFTNVKFLTRQSTASV
jgi:hypothetical protein